MFNRTHPDRSGKKNQMHLRNFLRRLCLDARSPVGLAFC